MPGSPDLERVAAAQLAAILEPAPVGSALPVDSASPLCNTLELLVPRVLRPGHPEWERESIDGFFFASAMKTDGASAELAGTCILITDQAVTPFVLNVRLAGAQSFQFFRIRLGERGAGPLGISGPSATSRAAEEMLQALAPRLADIDWAYDVLVSRPPAG